MEGQDISNFSNSSSSHRLPTISASEALRNASARLQGISTGLPGLDLALQPPSATTCPNGLPFGSVTEIYGPPGVGKTSFAMQVAVNALSSPSAHHGVVWIDTGAPLPGPRFREILAAYKHPSTQHPPPSPPAAEHAEKLIDNVSYFNVPTLAHLLTLFLHPTAKFPPPRTSLIVVDNVSALFATAFPRSADRLISTSTSTFAESARNAAQQKAANRKWAVAGDLAAAMAKIAQLHNASVLVVNQVATSLKGLRRAVLKPSLSWNAWDAGVGSRVLLYRDLAPRGGVVEMNDVERRGTRFAEVLKVSGKLITGNAAAVVPFVIEGDGLKEIHMASSPTSIPTVPSIPPAEDKGLKRKADEIADSEDDEGQVDSEDDLGVLDEFLGDNYESELERFA